MFGIPKQDEYYLYQYAKTKFVFHLRGVGNEGSDKHLFRGGIVCSESSWLGSVSRRVSGSMPATTT